MHPVRFLEIGYGSPEYERTLALREAVLLVPIGLCLADLDRTAEPQQRHLAGFEAAGSDAAAELGRCVACLVLVALDRTTVRMRQVAVAPERQGQGVGRELVRFAEELALQSGFRTMLAHARANVVGFYRQLGYETRGEPFIEVAIPHRLVQKALCGA